MRKDVFHRPAGQIQPDPIGQKAEAGFRQVPPSFTQEHDVKLIPQGMQVQDVGRRLGDLGVGELARTPVR